MPWRSLLWQNRFKTTHNIRLVLDIQLLNKAIKYHKDEELKEAISAYTALLNKFPHDANVHHLLGIAYAQQEQYSPAKKCFEQALKYNPDEPSIYNNYGNLLKKLGKSEEAKHNYLASLQRQPYNPSVHNNIGALLYQHGDIDGAVGHFNQALSQKPDYVDAMYNLSLAYLHQTKPSKKLAFRSFLRTLELEENHPGANQQIAQLYHQQNELKQAITHYRKSLDFNPDDAETLANIIGTKEDFVITSQVMTQQTSSPTGSIRLTREFIIHPDEIKRLSLGQAIFVNKQPFNVQHIQLRKGVI